MKIVVNKEVRALLVELDDAMQTFHNMTKSLAPGSGLDEHMAVEVGAEREHVKRQILGIAWRINKASRGEK